MTLNYSNWPVDKLKKERNKIEKAIKLVESRDKKSALAELVAVAKKNGFELHELVGAPGVTVGTNKSTAKLGKKRGKVAPKYRNPADASQTWTGRGRKPHWVQDLENTGRSLDDVLISIVSA